MTYGTRSSMPYSQGGWETRNLWPTLDSYDLMYVQGSTHFSTRVSVSIYPLLNSAHLNFKEHIRDYESRKFKLTIESSITYLCLRTNECEASKLWPLLGSCSRNFVYGRTHLFLRMPVMVFLLYFIQHVLILRNISGILKEGNLN